MSSRKTFTQSQRNEIWLYYINSRMWDIFNNDRLNELQDSGSYIYAQAAPCPFCGEKMLKAQYQGVQPDKSFSWDIDHIDNNPTRNNVVNLQPMHPWCNKKKAGQNI